MTTRIFISVFLLSTVFHKLLFKDLYFTPIWYFVTFTTDLCFLLQHSTGSVMMASNRFIGGGSTTPSLQNCNPTLIQWHFHEEVRSFWSSLIMLLMRAMSKFISTIVMTKLKRNQRKSPTRRYTPPEHSRYLGSPSLKSDQPMNGGFQTNNESKNWT